MIKLYRPSNGSEGCSFQASWCDKCARIVFDDITEEYLEGCKIFMKTMIFDSHEPEYPNEWRYCPLTNKPVCTAFVHEIPYSVVDEIDPNQVRF